ncbi:DNA-dependent protein kinase catalytic subunit [Ixodes scapularis]
MAGSLRGSSLAQEASQYSLSASGLAFWDVETVDSDSSKGTQAPAKEPVSRLKVMDLEDDALNGHECMASVCAVLCRMADLGIIPQTADEEVNIGPAPKWLTFLTNAIVGNHTTRNALCFICRVVVNSAEGLLISARLSLASKLLPLLLKSCSKPALHRFFVDNVTAMVDAVAAKIRHGSESELTSKIVALSCLEVLYSCCLKDDVTGKQSSVNAAFCRSRGIVDVVGNELTKEITKHANSAKKEVVRRDVEFADLWRQLRCAAYRLVVAVVSCTQTESQFYDVFVFQERPEKGEFLWNNLVDEKAVYTFPLEREVLFQKSRHVVGVTEGQVPSPSFSGRMAGSLRGSSLAQEASQYSLSASGLAFWDVETVDSDSSKGTQAPAKEPVSRLKVMDLEDDALNGHECMASVCAVLCRMADLGIIPQTADEEVNIGPAPKWLTFLTNAIVGNHTTRNALCFICRVVVNSAEVLRVHSRHLVPALLNVLAGDKLGSELDAFVIDVAVTVLMWASDWSLEDRKTVGNDRDLQGFSELLAQRCGHERREVLKNNLELLRAWVEMWRERLRFPADVVLEQLEQCSLDSKDHHAVLLFGIFVSNNLVEFGQSHASTARILEVLPRLLASRYRGAYTSVADVVGLTLRKMSEAGIATEDSAFEGSVASRLDGLLAAHRDQFVLCVRNVCRFYQPLALRFLDKLMLLLPRALADFKVAVLEVLSLCCHQMEQPVGRLQGLGFLELLAHGDEKMQTVLLEICTKLVGAATEEDWGAILPVVCQLQGHTSGPCRKLVYDVCMRLYAKYRSKTSAAGLAKQSKHILLVGLGDPEDSLRLSVANFWSQETQLPLKARERLVALLAGMYSPEIEDHFLSSVTFLLLELASRSPDYGRKLFPRPLSDCRFVDYAVTGSWRQRHAAMTPLFAETLSWSQSQSSTTTSQSTTTSATTDPGPMLRATQAELQFTPTQRGTSGAAATTAGSFNWLTQSTLESNLSGAERRRSLSILSFAPVQEEVLLGASQTSQKSKELGFLRRRFLRDEDKVRLQHIKREVRRKELRGEQERERRARREAEVTLYRSYRLGDLPDIEIPHSALVAPLQALAQHDQQVAQVLLTSIVKTVVKDGADLPELCRELEVALSSILVTSDRCFPPLVAFVQETSFSCAGGLKLPVDAVAKASVASGHQSLGILVLEEVQRVRALSEPRPPSPKRTRKEAAQACGPWLQMAQLYKSLGDYDTVRATLSCSEDVDAKAKEALQKEAQGDYSGARDAYRNLVSSGSIWDDAVLQCCRLLGEWTELQREVDSRLARSAGNKWDRLWDGGYSEEHYLPLYVKSRVKTALELGSGEDQFLESIRQWLEDPARKRLLEAECVEELVLLFLLQKDMGKADYYVRCFAEQFLEEWSGLSVLTPALLEGKLESLMVLSDLAEYVKHHTRRGTEDDVDRLLSKWRLRVPSNADSVLLWNDVILNRCFLVKSLGQSGAGEKGRLLNAFAGAMLQRDNIPTALRCVLEIEKMRTEGQLEGSLEWSYAETYCSALCRAAEQVPLDKKLASHLRTLQKLEATRAEGLDDAASTVRYCLLKAQAVAGLAKDLDAGAVLNKEQMAELQLASTSSDPRKMSLELREQALQLHLSAAHCEATPVSVRAEAQLRLARFCNTALQQEEGTLFPDDRRASLPLSLVRSVLTAMRLGSDAAIDMFPRLLQVLQSHPLCGKSFAEECAKVPCWMFLGWIGQMLPLLDGAVGPHLFGLVDSIASDYPNALVYAFRVSNEAYSFDIPETKDFILRLKQKMDKLPLVSEFIEALELLQFPDVAFKNWCESMREALNNQKSVDVRKLYADGVRQLFGGQGRDLALSSGGGIVHRHFSDVVKKKVTDAFGIEGSKLVKMDAKKFGSECQVILKSYKSLEPTALKDLSPWLSRFSALDRDNKIEIPGQYTGRSKPMPEYHVNIFGFEESVLVLKSMQRPCRITIRGDDEKEHRFLVKTGEDLRQDDRIERLFGAMNALFTADPSCRAKHLQLVTYGVVPLTTRVGLIEWLDGTVVLKDFQRRGLDESSQGNLARCSRSFGLWSTEDYAKAYKEPSQAVSRFGRCVRQVSRESLSKALLGLSSCPEAFFALRSRFVLSHATLCVAHWVLGVGDRHLGNFLVSTNTGLEIGIDFGYAFGLTAQFLPIPELMPFRLSPQYLGLLEPLGKEGPLASAMQDALRALRAGAESILDVLDVFVQEPTVDWMRLAKRQQAGSSPQASKRQRGAREVSLDWFPRQKVSIVRQKLEGGHPSYILRDELKLRKTNQPDFASLELVCLGAPGVESRMRRRFARGDKLSPRDQVDCLLEQATDPAILGLTWTGWEPWL